jgi:hypothetical protein
VLQPKNASEKKPRNNFIIAHYCFASQPAIEPGNKPAGIALVRRGREETSSFFFFCLHRIPFGSPSEPPFVILELLFINLSSTSSSSSSSLVLLIVLLLEPFSYLSLYASPNSPPTAPPPMSTIELIFRIRCCV